MDASDRTWPGIPAGQKYSPTRISGEFKQLVANRRFSNEEIGRIVRCILMETDFFMTPRIEVEVHHYRQSMERKKRASERIHKWRMANKAEKTKSVREEHSADHGCGGGAVPPDSISPCQKTPSIFIEKTPPIVPLEKNVPSSLEKGPPKRPGRSKADRLANVLQQDLFSWASGCSSAGAVPESTETARKGTVERSDEACGRVGGQDIGSDSRGVYDALDTRAEAAWIPERFAVFWERYPRRIGKASAQKAFAKLIKKQKDVERFMKTTLSSLEWWKRQNSWVKDNGRFIPYPATWLNGGHWEDITENKDGFDANSAEFLNASSESDAELIRRMQGG